MPPIHITNNPAHVRFAHHRGVEIVKCQVDGLVGYEGGFEEGAGFKKDREGVEVRLRSTTESSGKKGIGLQVVLFPSKVKAKTEKALREHLILVSYRGVLVLEEEHEVGYWRTVELKVCVRRRAGPRITRMGVRDDFVGLELDVDYEQVVKELEESRMFFVDKAGKVGMETMGRTLSTDARNLEFFASGGLSDSEEDDDKSVRSVGEGMGSVGEGGGWVLPDLNRVVSYGRCGEEVRGSGEWSDELIATIFSPPLHASLPPASLQQYFMCSTFTTTLFSWKAARFRVVAAVSFQR